MYTYTHMHMHTHPHLCTNTHTHTHAHTFQSTEPFIVEEVVEQVLPALKWRAEGRAQREQLVRGGVLADEVGYGKTAIILGVIDCARQDKVTTL
jgi:hypothetical protein